MKGSSSPIKKGTTNGKSWCMSNVASIGDKDYVIMDKDLLRGLSEKEVEIEHLKTTIIALNQKIEVTFIHIFIMLYRK